MIVCLIIKYKRIDWFVDVDIVVLLLLWRCLSTKKCDQRFIFVVVFCLYENKDEEKKLRKQQERVNNLSIELNE